MITGAPGARRVVRKRSEPVVFLFLDVVANVLDQHGDLGVEGLHLRRQASQFGEHPDHDVVFFHAFQHVVLGLGTASRAVG
jgi:hypothetical protein